VSFDLQYVQMNVASYMERIVKHFKPGVKIAVLVRSPGFPDRDFMMTDDSIPELRAMLDRREPPPKKQPCGECHGSSGETCDICGAQWPQPNGSSQATAAED